MASFNVVDCGAYTSDRLMTVPFQKAIDACFLSGGGEVIVPDGIYRIGAIRLRSHVTLHLLSGAIVEGSEDPQDYFGWQTDEVEPLGELPDPYDVPRRSSTPFSAWSNGLIRILNAEDVAIIGDAFSYIDGRNVFDPRGEEGYRGPHGISAWHVKGLTLQGYTLRNTGNWAHALFFAEDVDVKGVTVYAGHDGLDLFLCRRVQVENCCFHTGDDCLAGFGSVDVDVRHCQLYSACSALRFGGTHVHIQDCQSSGPAPFAHRGSLSDREKALSRMPNEQARHNTKTAFLYYCDERFGPLPEKPGDILIENCRFHQIDQLFNMDFGRYKWCCHAPLTSLTFRGCSLSGMVLPLYIHGDADEPLSLTLENCTLSPAAGREDLPVADIENYRRFCMKGVSLTGFTDPTVIDRGSGELCFTDSTTPSVQKGTPGESTLHGH